ncbi:4'-phosphopantetheinyl transferase family protein [Bradyrhizobium sp.]|uniref:4'-phosphopantetheinyl transferase family protein n=1 Tax=Bradyrhizobium sp. TaxID=376 RepID=UPI0039E59641
MNTRLASGDSADLGRHALALGDLETSDLEVVFIHLDASAGASVELWDLLSNDEQRRAERFRYAEHRHKYILARAGLRRLLAERLHVAPRAIELVENSYDKPRLAPKHGSTDLKFNLSHSANLAVYAFTRGPEVGVDVEQVRQIPDAAELAEGFFSPDETVSLKSLPIDQRSLAFLACWTRKEAVIKAMGLGLSCPLDAFDVTIDPHGPARVTRIDARFGKAAHWQLRAFTPCQSYIAAVACHTGNHSFDMEPQVLIAPATASVNDMASISWP